MTIPTTNPLNPANSFATDMLVCYEIRLYLSSRLAKLAEGEPFEFLTTDPDAFEAVPEWCDQRGFTLLTAESAESRTDGHARFVICR
jgi:TusA-related sulfurtransferase